jgi:hypothetical protein
MPDLQNYSITKSGSKSVSLPIYTISGMVNDSQTGALLADFSGAKSIVFPDVWATLTVAQRDDLIASMARTFVQIKTGY